MKIQSLIKVVFGMIGALAMLVCSACLGEKIIVLAELPAQAQTFVQTHFANRQVAVVAVDREIFKTEYTVTFMDGDSVEFDGNGLWKEIDCKTTSVPAAAIPGPIQAFVAQNFAGVPVVKIERNSREIEVKLANRIELEFDLQFRLKELER